MKIAEVISQKSEAKAPEKLCKSRTPDDQLGASQLASCKSQGYRKRSGKKSYKIGKKRVYVSGKKIKLRDLNYWNVDLQEPYFSYIEASIKREKD